PRGRLREVLLRGVRRAPLQPQPRRPDADERPHGGLRRGPRRPPELARVRRLRAALGARPRRRPRALRRGEAALAARYALRFSRFFAGAGPAPNEFPARTWKRSFPGFTCLYRFGERQLLNLLGSGLLPFFFAFSRHRKPVAAPPVALNLKVARPVSWLTF